MEAIDLPPHGQPAEHDSPPEMPTAAAEYGPFRIAGFWRRLLAVLIDWLILGIPLFVFGLALCEWTCALGPWARLIGYGILLLYAGLLNSHLGGGATVGKRLMGLRVVDGRGACLSVRRSLLRTLILIPIGLLNGWAVLTPESPVFIVMVNGVILGGGLSLAYAMIFNRRTRQGIHDLVAGSYVARNGPGSSPPQIPRIHKYLTCGLLGVGFVLGLNAVFSGGVCLSLGLMRPGEWEHIRGLHATLSRDDRAFTATVRRFDLRPAGSPDVSRGLDIRVWARRPCMDDPAYCNAWISDIARLALIQYDGIDDLTGMRVGIVNRFDFGLATGSVTHGTAWRIEDWRKQLGLPRPARQEAGVTPD